MDQEEGWVPLADAIEAVRAELVEARRRGRTSAAGKDVLFRVGAVTIEFAGEVSTKFDGSVGAKFWVCSAEAKGERARNASSKVTVVLTPHGPDGVDVDVHDEIDEPPGR